MHVSTVGRPSSSRLRIYTKQPTTLEQHYYAGLIKKLVAARNGRGITQPELASRIGVSDSLVAKWECGIRIPSAFYLMCWCQALELQLWPASVLQ